LKIKSLVLIVLLFAAVGCTQQKLVLKSDQLIHAQALTNENAKDTALTHGGELTAVSDSGITGNAPGNFLPIATSLTSEIFLTQHSNAIFEAHKKAKLIIMGSENSGDSAKWIYHKPGRTLRVVGPFMILSSLIVTIFIVADIYLPGLWPWIFGIPMGSIFILGWIFLLVGLVMALASPGYKFRNPDSDVPDLILKEERKQKKRSSKVMLIIGLAQIGFDIFVLFILPLLYLFFSHIDNFLGSVFLLLLPSTSFPIWTIIVCFSFISLIFLAIAIALALESSNQ